MNNRELAQAIDEMGIMFKNLNVADVPNYRFMCAFKQALSQAGLPNSLAERVVTNMQISVSAVVWEQAEPNVRKLIGNMAVCVAHMYAQVKQDFETDPDPILLSMSRGMTLKLEY